MRPFFSPPAFSFCHPEQRACPEYALSFAKGLSKERICFVPFCHPRRLSPTPVLDVSNRGSRVFSFFRSRRIPGQSPGHASCGPSLPLPFSLFVILSTAKGLSKERICFSMRSVIERKKVPSLRSRQARRVERPFPYCSRPAPHAALLSPSFVRRGVGALGMPRALTRGRGICTPTKHFHTHRTQKKQRKKD